MIPLREQLAFLVGDSEKWDRTVDQLGSAYRQALKQQSLAKEAVANLMRQIAEPGR